MMNHNKRKPFSDSSQVCQLVFEILREQGYGARLRMTKTNWLFFLRQAQDDENGFFNDPVTVLSFLLVVVRKTISFCHPDPAIISCLGRISK